MLTPRSARAVAIAAPIPLDEPVTNATRPCRSATSLQLGSPVNRHAQYLTDTKRLAHRRGPEPRLNSARDARLLALREAEHPRIVNVSSGVGSFHRILAPGSVENAVTLPVYPATKAALNMLTVQYARTLDGILVNAADPGFTGTDFNNHRGTQTVAEGTDAIVRLATLPPDGPTGTFQDRYGTVPW
jgi:NAD(P)-dependent dehydrogenase (short-subunit alcohol dehydrogenase family)